jgi:inner membrane protein
MDNLTHSLFAITLSRTPLSRAGRGTTAALLLASNAPDIDIVAAAGGGVNYLSWHRGLTHGPLGVTGLGVVTAGIVWAGRRVVDRRRARAGAIAAADTAPDASFAMLIAVSIIGVLLHVLMDLPTSYGTRLLSPFSWRWFTTDWMPILDIYLLLIMVIPALRRLSVARRLAAAIVLVMAAASSRSPHHRRSETVARVFGPTPPSVSFTQQPRRSCWPRTAARRRARRQRCHRSGSGPVPPSEAPLLARRRRERFP